MQAGRCAGRYCASSHLRQAAYCTRRLSAPDKEHGKHAMGVILGAVASDTCLDALLQAGLQCISWPPIAHAWKHSKQ